MARSSCCSWDMLLLFLALSQPHPVWAEAAAADVPPRGVLEFVCLPPVPSPCGKLPPTLQ